MNVFQNLWHKQLKQPFVLTYDIEPGNGETVVLLHGIASERSLWTPLVTNLKRTNTKVVSIDLLGHGGSPRPKWLEYNTDEQAKAVKKTLKKIGASKNLVIVGHSMGALVAARISTRNPKLVKKLILFEPPIFADHADYPKHLRRRNFYFNVFERLAAHPSEGIISAKALGFIATNWADLGKSDDTWLPIQRSLRNTIMQQSIFDELRHITIPTAIVHGRLDFIVTRKEVKKMYRDNPHITFYKTTVSHGLNTVSARLLARLIVPGLKKSKTPVKLQP